MPTKTKKKPARPDQINVQLDPEHWGMLRSITDDLSEKMGEKVKNSFAIRWLIRLRWNELQSEQE